MRRLLRLLALAPALIVLAASTDEAAAMRGGRSFGGGGSQGNAGFGRGVTMRPQINQSTITGQYRIGKVRRVTEATRPPGDRKPPPKKPPRHRPPVVVKLPPLLPPTVTTVAPPPQPSVTSLPPSGSTPSRLGPGPAFGARLNIPAPNERRYVPDEVLVSFSASVNPQAVVGIAQGQRLALLGVHRLSLIDTTLYRFRITDGRSVPTVIASFGSDSRINRVQPNYLYAAQDEANADARPTTPGDPAQYVLGKLMVPQAHGLARGERVLVAVIDSSIDVTHPDLQGMLVARFDATKTPDRPHRHGTAMAGAIAAHGKLLGVAPAARILAARAFDPTPVGAASTTTWLLDSLQWASDSGARVINMSFAGPSDPRLHDMIAAARRKGATLIAAAGNDGPSAMPAYPAAYAEVIAVTATDMDDQAYRQSNRGNHVAVAAPGVDIFVAAPNAGYDMTTGTSVAAAHVSGIAALLLERYPGLTPDALQDILLRTAKDLGPPGRDEAFGAGLVNAYDALNALAPHTAEQVPAN